MIELKRRATILRAEVDQRLCTDNELLLKTQQQTIRDWCAQVSVLGFNFGKYDLNLIKQHLLEDLTDTCSKVEVATEGSEMMFVITPDLLSLVAPHPKQLAKN